LEIGSETVDRELVSELTRISHELCADEGGPHGPDHSERVFRMCLRLGREMGADTEILTAASLLHDIGRKAERASRGRLCHARLGARMAAGILADLGLDRERIDRICHCIRTHRFRSDHPPESLEAKILFDADKLDSIGAIGIGRAFLFAGQIGACLHNPEQDHEETLSYSREDSAYREFQVKMSRVRERLLTSSARAIAEGRHRFMEEFFTRLNSEIYGQD